MFVAADPRSAEGCGIVAEASIKTLAKSILSCTSLEDLPHQPRAASSFLTRMSGKRN
jgi:hypothetical protein